MELHKPGYLDDDERVQRATRNLAKFLGDLHKIMSEFMAQNETIRKRILTDVKALVGPLPKSDHGALLRAIAVGTQKVFSATKSLDVQIDTCDECLGGSGGGVTATSGAVTVTACVRGTPETGLEGGGVEVSYSY